MTAFQWFLKTPIGPLYLVASDTGLMAAVFDEQDVPFAKSLRETNPAVQILAEATRQLKEYFDGQRTDFQLPLQFSGTEFQKRVWTELGRIPYGGTISYKQLAARVKNEKACRAVGTANGRNPLCIILPCHRVIAADGRLGGYTGGLHIKTKLLEIEQKTLQLGTPTKL